MLKLIHLLVSNAIFCPSSKAKPHWGIVFMKTIKKKGEIQSNMVRFIIVYS